MVRRVTCLGAPSVLKGSYLGSTLASPDRLGLRTRRLRRHRAGGCGGVGPRAIFVGEEKLLELRQPESGPEVLRRARRIAVQGRRRTRPRRRRPGLSRQPGPFAAYVELGFAKGFFYGTVVCANYATHRTKSEVVKEERAEEKASEEGATRFIPGGCSSPLIEVELKQVTPGEDPVVASHKAEAAEKTTLLPLGTSEKNAKGSVLSFEFKLEPKKTKGTFYAVSEECFGTSSRRVDGA